MGKSESYNLYHQRKDNGLCVDCGKKLPCDSTITRCPECSIKHNKRNKEDRKKLIALKVCICCRKEYAEPYLKMCYECAKKSRDKHEEWLSRQDISELNERKKIKQKEVYTERKANGVCVRCGKRKALPLHVQCGICNEKHTTYKRICGNKKCV